ncbi:helix-turn-helix domain-containing protein [Streptomyces sp. NPDC001339]|uniref:helix-turn-helix domain-containing protein n=1 Tax=Streptomyces sp. NPDC001339 TaxID=3364563 RepID=UPI0036C011DD
MFTGSPRRCKHCNCLLSRYNDEQYCAECSRENRALSRNHSNVPAHVWELPEVQHALIHREFGLMCRLIRRFGGLRQEDVAVATGLSQAFLSYLESDTRRLTNIDKIIQLLDGLQAPPELTGPMLRPSNAQSAQHG